MCEDISGGQEDVPIPATNLVDDPPVAPTGKLSFQICCLSDGYLICMHNVINNILEIYKTIIVNTSSTRRDLFLVTLGVHWLVVHYFSSMVLISHLMLQNHHTIYEFLNFALFLSSAIST